MCVLVVRIIILIWVAGLWAAGATAQSSPCVSLYRSSYVEYGASGGVKSKEAAAIYLIFFDHSQNIREAYLEAFPIFSALGVSPDKESVVLNEFSKKMESGEFCPGGVRYSLEQIVAALRSSL